MSKLKGVLLMAYGTPRNLDEVEPYYRDILRGREPRPEAVAELTERYRRVGGKTPLLEITHKTADLLGERLSEGDDSWRTYVGMKHWHPYIAETVEQIATDGVEELVAVVLAPHYSRGSIAEYQGMVVSSLEGAATPRATRFIESWHANPLFIQLIARRIQEALALFDADPSDVEVLFTAHSLPARILDSGDPYPDELLGSAEAVANAAGVASWRFSYQSAGKTGMAWLGPDILDSIEAIADEGGRNILVAPFGFVCDHLEILFDVDIEARDRAAALGVNLQRIEMPNDSPEFIEVLHDLVATGEGARAVDL